MAAKTWGAGTGPVDGKWSTAVNWTGDTVPQAGDDVTFDGTDVTNCDIDVNTANLGSLTAMALYTGTLDGATSNKDVSASGDIILDCTRVDMGSGTWTCGGIFDYKDITTFNENTSLLVMNVNGGSMIGTHLHDLYDLRISANVSINPATATNFTVGRDLTVDVGKTFTIDNDVLRAQRHTILNGTITGTATAYFSGGTLTIGAAGELSIATMTCRLLTIVQGGTFSPTTCQMLQHITLGAGTYGGTITFDIEAPANRTVTINGDIVFTGNVTFLQDQAGQTYTIDNSSNHDLTFRGNVTITHTAGTFTWTKGTGTITLSGAGAGVQTIDFDGKTVEDIVINDAGATKQLTGALVTDSFTLTNGSLDPNGQDITTVLGGDFTVSPGGQVSTPTNLNGTTWTVAGNLLLIGEVGDQLNLAATGAWTLTVAGAIAGAAYVTVAHSDASGGTEIKAPSCTNVDGGNNANWNFDVLVAVTSFTATPSRIGERGSSTLAWTTFCTCSALTGVAIDHGIGAVPEDGSVIVSPNATTTYTITAICNGGSSTATVTVMVDEGTPVADFSRRVLGRYRRPRR